MRWVWSTRSLMVYPAGVPKAIGVGSTTMTDTRSAFSNYGDDVRLAAPGEALITTYPGNNYAGVWGTSFSTALVSGAAALLSQMRAKGWQGSLMDAFEHGQRLHIDGMGDARLDVYASAMYYLTVHSPGD